ncbi:hypothetical protein [Nocardia sp. NPDC019395]|uniref:hypothetical protein n=1 Tax=Nocardia sp. NPDC019395 TaxID=3154686 RepID=UPI0033C41406
MAAAGLILVGGNTDSSSGSTPDTTPVPPPAPAAVSPGNAGPVAGPAGCFPFQSDCN